MTTWTHKALKGFFWFAFAAFLAASIPHVAYFFRAFEPLNDNGDAFWWVVSYFIAASIDVTIFLLSVTVAGLQRQKKSTQLILSVWAFIVGLAVLSWFINYKYAAHFIDTSMLSATPVTLPFLSVSVSDINPVIASCFQVLAIAYTWISDKIAANESPKTAAELEMEANELHAVATQKQRIAAIKRESSVNGFKALIDAGSEVFQHTKSHLKQDSSEALQTQPDTIETQSRDTDTEELEILNFPSSATHTDDEKGNREPQTSDGNEVKNRSQNTLLDGLSGRSTVTIEDAAKIIGCEIKYVRTLRNRGKLKSTPRNDGLLTVASIKSYIDARKKGNREPQLRESEMQLRAVK